MEGGIKKTGVDPEQMRVVFAESLQSVLGLDTEGSTENIHLKNVLIDGLALAFCCAVPHDDRVGSQESSEGDLRLPLFPHVMSMDERTLDRMRDILMRTSREATLFLNVFEAHLTSFVDELSTDTETRLRIVSKASRYSIAVCAGFFGHVVQAQSQTKLLDV